MTNYFEFDTKAKILSGSGALSHIPYELKVRHAQKPFLMSDKGLEKLGVTDRAIKEMQLKDYELFTDIPVDSSTDTVASAVKAYKEAKCDSVIAVGGGSVIDTAKGAILSLVSGSKDLSKIEGADCVSKNKSILFVAVPTTAGTGSEMTSVAVIKDAKRQVKLEYISTFILPDIAVIDPIMTVTLPARITASTAMDALTHAIEAYSCLMKNPISDAYAVCAIKLISENILKVLENPTSEEGRVNLANAALMAGASFSNSMVGAVHSIGHALGAVSGVAHGDAMAILLPHVLWFNFEKCKKYYSELLHFFAPNKGEGKSETERAKLFIGEIKILLKTLNREASLALTLSETGKVKKEDFALIAEKAMSDGSAIVNPRPLSLEFICEILNQAY